MATKQRGLAAIANIQEPVFVVDIYSLLAFLSLGIFGILHIIATPHLWLGYLELGGGLLAGINILLAELTGSIVFAKYFLLSIMLAYLGLMLITGGTADTGSFWFFVFPVAAFFLVGKWQGLGWMIALGILIAGIWFLSADRLVTIAYTSVVIRQLLVVLAVASVGIYAYQRSREMLLRRSRETYGELLDEKARTDAIVQNIDEGVVTTDAVGNVLFANHAAQELLGWRTQELLHKKFIEIVPMIDQRGVMVAPETRPLYLALKTQKPVTTVATYRQKDGQTIPVSVTSTVIMSDSRVIGGIDMFRDIREEQSIARTKSEFVTIASHQLRTPISTISWLSELLLDQSSNKLSPEQREHILNIYRSNQRMGWLVNQMLIVSSLDLGSLPVVLEEVNLTALADQILQEQLSQHHDKELDVSKAYPADAPTVPCDPDIARLLLRNVMSNACKYTPKHGHVTVKITIDYARKLKSDSRGSVVVAISDTGYGIPHKDTDKIFTKFFRAKNITHKDTDGTGLGLYVVKALLDYVGGSINFTSQEGKGSTFTIALPLEGMLARRPQADSLSRTTKQSALQSRSRIHV